MKYFYSFLLCWAMAFTAYTQSSCEIDAPFCADAIPVGSQNFTGTLPFNINNGGAIPGCGGAWAFHNTIWYEIKPRTTDLALHVTPSNCMQGIGFQIGLFKDCDPFEAPLFIQCACTVDPVTFAANGLTPGQSYYLMLDGCSGDVCDFSIQVVQGFIDPVTNFGPVEAPTPSTSEVCLGDVVFFNTNFISVDAEYTWTFPDGVFPIDVDCNTAAAIWDDSTGGYVVVTATNINDTTLVTSDSVYISVFQPSDTTIFGSYCYPDDPGYLLDTAYLPIGTTLFEYSSAQGCDSNITYVITNNVRYEEALICPGETVTILGNTYDSAVNEDRIDLGVPSSLGCDSIALVSIYELNIEASISANSTVINCLHPFVELTVSAPSPSQYDWSTLNGNILTSSSDSTIQVDQPGTYYLELTRDTILNAQVASCTIIDSIVISENFETPIVTVDLTNESCDGINDGAVIVMVSNLGIGPFTYDWLDPSLPDSAMIPSIAPGSYELVVTAANGCTKTETVVIVPSFDLSLSSTFSDCDTLNGTATATVAGGSTNLIFEWSNGQTGNIITGLAPGGYSVTATDQVTNCRTHRNVMVEYDSSCVSYISGYVFNDDVLMNCAPPLPGLSNIMVFLDNGQATATDSMGYYEFEVEPGVYTITVNYSSVFIPVCADPIPLDVSVPDVYLDNNFFLKYRPNNDLKLKVSKPNPRPGFSRRIRICLMNVGGSTMSGTLTFVHDEMQTFESSNPVEDNYDANTRTISWDFTNIPPGAVWIYYPVMFTPQSVPVGETIDYYFKADPIQGDLTPLNNEWNCSLVTTNAYDPNDKQVMPMGEGPEGLISREDSLLGYHIRFQNTGTDTAYTVIVRDTLDPQLNIGTLVPGPASHPYRLNVEKGNILEFVFENIYLPDSTVDLEGSNGFVFFDIEFDKTIEEGSDIRNSAAIYFDFNPPIITNEVINTIRRPVGISSLIGEELEAQIFPNPSMADGTLFLDLSASGNYEVVVMDIQGRVLKTLSPWQAFSAGKHMIPLEMKVVPPGVYLITIRNAERQIETLKWAKFE